MAEDAITLSSFSTSEKECQEIAQEMLSISNRGMENAENVYQGFRDVRMNIEIVWCK